MTDLVPYDPPRQEHGWIELMQPAADLASQIAGTDFVPEAYRRNPAAIAACIMFGAEIGIGPMQALAKIDIVKGRPAPRAELARAKALAAGHDLWTEESTNTRVTVSGKRRGSNHVQSVTWTMDDVKKAGISNGNYSKYPRQMLLARASSELVRMMCPEVLGGITVFAEEAADIVDDGPVDVGAATVEKPKTTTRKRRTQPADIAPSEPVDTTAADDTDKPTAAQTKKAMACFNEAGITDRQERLDLTSAYLGRTVASWNDLTKAEAVTVIDRLEQAGTPAANDDDTLPLLPDEITEGGE